MTAKLETIPQIVRAAARMWNEAPALVEAGETWSFRRLAQACETASIAFNANGIGPGDVVAIWAPNSAVWVVAAVGAQMAGAAITPLNTRLKGLEAGDILRRARARMLITVGNFLGTDYPALLQAEPLPDLRATVLLDAEGPDGWNAFLQGAKNHQAIPLPGPAPDDICDIMFTSGTTGAPKGAMHTHASTVRMFRDWAARVDLRAGDRYLIANPFFHTFGYKAGWLACLLTGATAYPVPVFDAVAVADLVARARIGFLPGPPTIFQSLLAARVERALDLSSLRVTVTGAAPVAEALVRRMRDELGVRNVVNGYGMTECGAIAMTCLDDDPETVATTCGRPLPGLSVRCVTEAGAPAAADEEGEILVRGPGVMLGYLDDPAATAEAVDADGWLHTGDIGRMDARGYLRITDRKKDMFITGGFNCYPAEIEKLLCAHPAIEAAAVIGMPDARLGEVGRAFVVLRPGQSATPDGIIAWARGMMANYKVPRAVDIVTDLPRNASNKVQKTLLRQ